MKSHSIVTLMAASLLPVCVSAAQVSNEPALVQYCGKDLTSEVAVKFFTLYVNAGREIGTKTQFETEEEYRKRLPPDFKPQDDVSISWHPNTSLPNFEYDLKKQEARVTARFETTYNDSFRVADLCHSSETTDKTYAATNAFGAERTVAVTHFWDCRARIVNWKSFQKGLFIHDDVMGYEAQVKFNIDPGKAESLSKNFEIVLRLRPLNEVKSELGAETHHSTFSEPYDASEYFLNIDFELRSISIRDKRSGDVVFTIYPK